MYSKLCIRNKKRVKKDINRWYTVALIESESIIKRKRDGIVEEHLVHVYYAYLKLT